MGVADFYGKKMPFLQITNVVNFFLYLVSPPLDTCSALLYDTRSFAVGTGTMGGGGRH